MKNELTEYERSAVASIHEWKNPKIGWFGKAMEVVNWGRNSKCEKNVAKL
jgi:hypothetical protein